MEKPLSGWKDPNATGGFIGKQGTQERKREKRKYIHLSEPNHDPSQ
tara:strand:+ start:227 stop:364 length:138 start_codon:yes stop_codon:yes gene_type:complete